MERWRINPICALHWHTWGDDNLVFNAASGQTHYLNALGLEALRLLGQQALTVPELENRLVACFENFDLDAESRLYIETMINDMDSLGLIEPYTA